MTPAPAFPTTVPELACETLRLRALTEADIPAWFARATDAESADLAGDPIPASIAQGPAWLERHREQFRRQAAIRWAIVPTHVPIGTAECAGTIGLIITPPTAELAIVIARPHWNQGLATAAARLVLTYAAHPLALTEIHAEILQRNHASRRLMAKLGFRHLCRIADEDPYDIHTLRLPLERPSP